MIMVNFMGFGDKDHRGKGPFSHHLKSVLINMTITTDVNFNHLTEVVCVKFIHCLVFPHPCPLHSVVFGRNSVEVM